MFFVVIAGLGAGCYLFFMGFRWWRLKRIIENIPTSKVRSLAMGLAELYGKVVPQIGRAGTPELLKSPFTNRDCIYYRYKVEEYKKQGKNSRWVTIKAGTDAKLFYLEDETGKVLVQSAGADIDIFMDNQFRSTSPIIASFLQQKGVAYENSFFGLFSLGQKNMRFSEWFVEPGDYLYVLGTAADNPLVAEGAVEEGHKDIMIRKGDIEKLFLITDRDEKTILKSLTWKVLGGVVGGGLLTVICLVIILATLGMFR
jgi:hypothetical protein